LTQAGGEQLAAAFLVALMGFELAGEFLEAERSEDALGELLLDEGEEGVLAEVDPFLVGEDLRGGGVAVAGAVRVTVQSSGPGAGIPCWCSESCGHGPRGGGGDL
jgi:hypothetical protein